MFGKAKTNYYYDSFPRLAEYAKKCSEALLDFMEHFDHAKLKEIKTSIHVIEHEADDEKHAVMEKLTREFMTPIDREDILELLRLIDDITDAIEEVPLKLYVYDYHELPADTIHFAKVVDQCIEKTVICLQHFPEFPKEGVLKPYIQEVIKLEEETDDIYEEDMHTMYMTITDGFARHRGEAMYTMLEETADRCRNVCKFVETIMYKNL
jgi:predicted phosphate transport protein (TIGR00153 family)